MSNPYFRFKKFTLFHDRCAMKVGTDGVLLGAWSRGEGNRILDIGCGCGLLALMMAQRYPKAEVTAVEIDESAVAQAIENVRNSPYANRVSICQADIRFFQSSFKYDTIVCNPPFYTQDILPPEQTRRLARNTDALSFEALIQSVSTLLLSDGTFHVVLPFSVMDEFRILCARYNLFVHKVCLIRTVFRKEPKRVLMTFGYGIPESVNREELVLQNTDGSRTDAYCQLTRDFYL